MKNEYGNYKIVQQGNQIPGHLFQLKGKQQWNGFCENTAEQLTWISTQGFLQKSKKGKQRNPPEKGIKLEKQCFSNKSLIANIVL